MPWITDRSSESRETLLWRAQVLERILSALEEGDYRFLSETAEDYQAQVDAIVTRLRARGGLNHRDTLLRAIKGARTEELRDLLEEMVAAGDRGRFRRHKDASVCWSARCCRAHEMGPSTTLTGGKD